MIVAGMAAKDYCIEPQGGGSRYTFLCSCMQLGSPSVTLVQPASPLAHSPNDPNQSLNYANSNLRPTLI